MERGKSFPVESIWIDRATRQRKELTQIDELASSIERVGYLIHPITIKRDGELVAGERRLTAIKQLGWTHIDVQFLEDMPEVEVKLIELEENIARVDLPWPDQCRAILEYHRKRTEMDPEWNKSRTAEALNISIADARQKMQVAEELESGNKMVAEAPKYSTARGIVQRASERAKFTGALKVEKLLNPVRAAEIEKREAAVPLINTDFASWLSSYSAERVFNFIHCDFPYGVNMHKSAQGGGAAFGTYHDTADVYWQLLDELKRAMSTIIADEAHLMFWFSMDYYQQTFDRLVDIGWNVNPFPLIWHKSDNTGILPDYNRGPRRIYETAFFAARGDRKIVQAVSNLHSAPGGDKTIHMNQKSELMLKYFFRMFVDKSTVMLDPTCGSASAVRAAKELGASVFIGLERDPEFFTRAVEHFNK